MVGQQAVLVVAVPTRLWGGVAQRTPVGGVLVRPAPVPYRRMGRRPEGVVSADQYAANLGQVAACLTHAPFVVFLFVVIVGGALAFRG